MARLTYLTGAEEVDLLSARGPVDKPTLALRGRNGLGGVAPTWPRG